MFRDKQICVTDHAYQRFVERTGISPNTPKIGVLDKITRSIKRSEYIKADRIVGLATLKGTTYAFDKLRNLLFALEAVSRGKRFRVITCLAKNEFEIA